MTQSFNLFSVSPYIPIQVNYLMYMKFFFFPCMFICKKIFRRKVVKCESFMDHISPFFRGRLLINDLSKRGFVAGRSKSSYLYFTLGKGLRQIL